VTKLDATQEAHLKAFEAAYGILVIARHDADERYAAMKEAELTGLKIDASRAARRAVTMGVPIARLGDKDRGGMKTRNFNTIKAFLDITADYAVETAEELYIDPLDERYSFDAEGKTLTLQLDDEALAAMINAWGDWDLWSAKHAGIDHETFTVKPDSDGRPMFVATSEMLIDGKWHLAIKWMYESAANQVEAREYVEGKGWPE
jgi:hypothetical protein